MYRRSPFHSFHLALLPRRTSCLPSLPRSRSHSSRLTWCHRLFLIQTKTHHCLSIRLTCLRVQSSCFRTRALSASHPTKRMNPPATSRTMMMRGHCPDPVSMRRARARLPLRPGRLPSQIELDHPNWRLPLPPLPSTHTLGQIRVTANDGSPVCLLPLITTSCRPPNPATIVLRA